jgi:hypothetical protein
VQPEYNDIDGPGKGARYEQKSERPGERPLWCPDKGKAEIIDGELIPTAPTGGVTAGGR